MAMLVINAANHKRTRVTFAVEVVQVFPMHPLWGRYASQKPIPNNSTEPMMK